MQIFHQIMYRSTSLELPWLALIIAVIAVGGGAYLLYRIVMQGMRSGKEMRLSNWFWWKK
jgi:peptidoglycan/LPS O-acetylase OafA/YrhL